MGDIKEGRSAHRKPRNYVRDQLKYGSLWKPRLLPGLLQWRHRTRIQKCATRSIVKMRVMRQERDGQREGRKGCEVMRTHCGPMGVSAAPGPAGRGRAETKASRPETP